MTTADVIARAKARIGVGLPRHQLNRLDFAIGILIPGALERYAKMAARSKRHRLPRKDFSAAPTAGVYDLSAVAGILPETITDIRLASGTTPFIKAKTYNDLLATHPTDCIVYYIQTDANGAAIRFSDTANSINTFATAIKVSANHVPTLAQLAAQDENDFIDMLVSMLNEKNAIIKEEDEEVIAV